MHPVTIQVEAVAGGVNHTMVVAYDSSTRADGVPAGAGGKKDFPDGREGIRSVPIARGLPLLLGRLALACVDIPLSQIEILVELLIGVDGVEHAHHCPMLDDNAGGCIHLVFNDRLRRSGQ